MEHIEWPADPPPSEHFFTEENYNQYACVLNLKERLLKKYHELNPSNKEDDVQVTNLFDDNCNAVAEENYEDNEFSQDDNVTQELSEVGGSENHISDKNAPVNRGVEQTDYSELVARSQAFQEDKKMNSKNNSPIYSRVENEGKSQELRRDTTAAEDPAIEDGGSLIHSSQGEEDAFVGNAENKFEISSKGNKGNSPKQQTQPPPNQKQTMKANQKLPFHVVPFPRPSWLTMEEQKKYLEYMQKYKNYSSTNPSSDEAKDINHFRELSMKVINEQQEFMQHLEYVASTSEQQYKHIHLEASKYIEEHIYFQQLRVKDYPRYYTQYDSVLLDSVQKENIWLTHEKTLLELGQINKVILPNMKQYPFPKLTNFAKVTKAYPVRPPAKSTSHWSPCVCSKDINVEKLISRYQPDIVISQSGLKCIMDNMGKQLNRQWEIPVTIRETETIEKSTLKIVKTIYIDKPFVPKTLSVKEKCQKYYKKAMLTLMQHPKHNQSLRLGKTTEIPQERKDALDAVDDMFGGGDVESLETFGVSTGAANVNTSSVMGSPVILPVSQTLDIGAAGDATAYNKPHPAKGRDVDDSSTSSVKHKRQAVESHVESKKPKPSKQTFFSDSESEDKLVIDCFSSPEKKVNSDDCPASPDPVGEKGNDLKDRKSSMKDFNSDECPASPEPEGPAGKPTVGAVKMINTDDTGVVFSAVADTQEIPTGYSLRNRSDGKTKSEKCDDPNTMCKPDTCAEPAPRVTRSRMKESDGPNVREKPYTKNVSRPKTNPKVIITQESTGFSLDNILQEQTKMFDATKPSTQAKFNTDAPRRNSNPTWPTVPTNNMCEDPCEYLEPAESSCKNVTYNLWKLGDLKLLIRCSIHGMEGKSGRPQTNRYVDLSPKMEYQAKYGAEQLTTSEVLRAWCSSQTKKNASIIRARVNNHNSDIMLLEDVKPEEIVEPRYQFNPGAASNILHTVCQKLISMPAGHYLLGHAPGNTHAHIKKNVDTKRGVYDLHQAYLNYMGGTSADQGNPLSMWTPVDPSIILPFHKKYDRVPCTFEPKDSPYANIKSVQQNKQGGKKKRKRKKKGGAAKA